MGLQNAGNFLQTEVIPYLSLNVPATMIFKSLILMNAKCLFATSSSKSSVVNNDGSSGNKHIMMIDTSRNADMTIANYQKVTHTNQQWNEITLEEKHSLLHHSDVRLQLISDPFPITSRLWYNVFNRTHLNEWQLKATKSLSSIPSLQKDYSQLVELMLTIEEAQQLHELLLQEGFLWKYQHPLANQFVIGSIFIKDPTEPIYVETFKRVSSFYLYYFIFANLERGICRF